MSRDVLILAYKLYVRLHFDYGDILYYRYEPEVQSIYTQNIEQMQYAVALTVTSALRGANRIRLYKELEWESVYSRSGYRRLCHLFNLKHRQSPEYLLSKIPVEGQMSYNHINSAHILRLLEGQPAF